MNAREIQGPKTNGKYSKKQHIGTELQIPRNFG